MQVKTSELKDKALDCAVALALGGTNLHYDTVATWWITIDGKDRALSKGWAQSFCPSTNWAHGGVIIDQILGFELKNWLSGRPELSFEAHIHNYETNAIQFGSTALVAAMRCFVESKLGQTVDIPSTLI